MHKIKYLTILFILAMLLVAAGGALASPDAAVAPVLSLQTKGFAVLGGSAVNGNGAASHVIGDLGASPTDAITGFPPGDVTEGTIHHADTAAGQARGEVTTAYSNLADQPCDEDLSGQDLGTKTLAPGVYCFGSSAGLLGILTLDAQSVPNAVWVFKIGTTLTTASNASVVMINGGKSCNVWWQIGTSATLGQDTAFRGNILANASISLDPSASMVGAALAGTGGAVTMASGNTIAACFDRTTAITIREIQATSEAGSPSWLGAGTALLLALGLIVIVIRQRVLATPGASPSARQGHGE